MVNIAQWSARDWPDVALKHLMSVRHTSCSQICLVVGSTVKFDSGPVLHSVMLFLLCVDLIKLILVYICIHMWPPNLASHVGRHQLALLWLIFLESTCYISGYFTDLPLMPVRITTSGLPGRTFNILFLLRLLLLLAIVLGMFFVCLFLFFCPPLRIKPAPSIAKLMALKLAPPCQKWMKKTPGKNGSTFTIHTQSSAQFFFFFFRNKCFSICSLPLFDFQSPEKYFF